MFSGSGDGQEDGVGVLVFHCGQSVKDRVSDDGGRRTADGAEEASELMCSERKYLASEFVRVAEG